MTGRGVDREARVWTGVDAEGLHHTTSVFESDPGWWEVVGRSSRTYESARRAAHADLLELRGLDIRHFYAPGEPVPPPRVWVPWPEEPGPWWMRLDHSRTVLVMADSSFIRGVVHVRLTEDISGRYMDQKQLVDGGARFCRVELAPTPPGVSP